MQRSETVSLFWRKQRQATRVPAQSWIWEGDMIHRDVVCRTIIGSVPSSPESRVKSRQTAGSDNRDPCVVLV